jgi:hypothetical protein
MKLERARIVIRERSLGETLDLVPRFIFTLNPTLYGRLAAIMLLPAYGLCLLAHVGGWPWASIWLVAIPCGAVLQGVFTVAASRVLFSDGVRVREVLRQYWARLAAYLGALTGAFFVMVLGAATVVLLPVAWTRVVFVHEATLLERASARAALARTARMVASGTAFAAQLVGALLLAQVTLVLATELLAQSLVGFILQCGQPFGSLLSEGGSPYALGGYFLSLPVVATGRFLAYIERRTRQDGWDVQVRFLTIRAQGPERVS